MQRDGQIWNVNGWNIYNTLVVKTTKGKRRLMRWRNPTLATPISSKESTNRGVASGNSAALTLRGPERVENTKRREKRKSAST